MNRGHFIFVTLHTTQTVSKQLHNSNKFKFSCKAALTSQFSSSHFSVNSVQFSNCKVHQLCIHTVYLCTYSTCTCECYDKTPVHSTAH